MGKFPAWSAQEGREKKLDCFLEQKTPNNAGKMYKWVTDSKISEILLLVAVMTCSLVFLLKSLLLYISVLLLTSSIICFGVWFVGFFVVFWQGSFLKQDTGPYIAFSRKQNYRVLYVLIKPISFESLKDYMLVFRRTNFSPCRLFCKPHLYSFQVFCLLKGRELSHAQGKRTNML